MGVFVNLLSLSGVDQFMLDVSDGRRFVLLGSFGALMTLLYSAPASPLVQPRNCVLGSTLSASIAIAFKYLSDPEYLQVIPDWMVRVTGERSQPTPRIFLIPRPCGGWRGCIQLRNRRS